MSDTPDPEMLSAQVYGDAGVPPMQTAFEGLMTLHAQVLESNAVAREAMHSIGLEWNSEPANAIIRGIRELAADEHTD
jgi:hypothetical protein